MDDKEKKTGDNDLVTIDRKTLETMQRQMAETEKTAADAMAKAAGLEELMAKEASTVGQPALREKKTFEPKFRMVRLRKYPVAGKEPDYVIGWTKKGAYQEVDRTGVRPEIVDYIDIVFLSEMERHEKAVTDGKTKDALQVEKIKLLDLMNRGEQVFCKVVDRKEEKKPEPTGETIKVSSFDPSHGMVETGEEIDGYVVFTDIELKLQIPGHGERWIDALYCNN